MFKKTNAFFIKLIEFLLKPLGSKKVFWSKLFLGVFGILFLLVILGGSMVPSWVLTALIWIFPFPGMASVLYIYMDYKSKTGTP